MERFAAVGLVRFDLPDSTTVRLSDGGAEIRWGSDIFAPRHALFGVLTEVQAPQEGVGVEVPALQLTMTPPGTAAAADLVAPGMQKARVRIWLAEYDVTTSTVIDAGDPLFDGFFDQAQLVRGLRKFELAISVVPQLEYLFQLNTGNSLNPTFHQLVWSGEGGEDHATGLSLPDAWGVEAPPQGISYAGTGSGQSVWTGTNNQAVK